MMWVPTAFLLLVLVCSGRCGSSQTDSCKEGGPGDCSFNDSFSICNWRATNWSITPGTNAYLLYNVTRGRIYSPKACPTNETWHYITFEYCLGWLSGNKLSLIMRAFGPISHPYKSVVTFYSLECAQFQTARVRVQSQYPFKLIFAALRNSSTRIGLKNFQYDKQQSTTDHTLISMIPERTSPNPTSATRPPIQITSSITTTSPIQIMSLIPTTSTTSKPANVSDANKMTSSTAKNTITIVGAVVAVVVVIGVGILVFMLFRRNKIHFWKTLFKDRKPKKTPPGHVSQKVAYSTATADPGNAGCAQMESAHPNHDYDRLDTTTSPQPSEDYYSVIRNHDAESPAHGPSMPQNSTLNEPRKPGRASPSKRRDSSDDSPYEIKDDAAGFDPQQPSRSGDHKSLRSNTSGQLGGPASVAADYSLLRSADKDTTVIGGGAAGVYHCLEADREARSSLEQRQSGTGLYHCLEGDPATEGPQGETGVYLHLEEDPEIQGPQGGTGVYHCLEEDPETQKPRYGSTPYIQEQGPAMTAYRQTTSVYDVPKSQRTRNPEKCHYVPDAAQNPTSDSRDGDYNSLDFNGKSFAAERREDAPDKVYSHLNGGDEDAYSEVDRERRREVIDGDYSHVS